MRKKCKAKNCRVYPRKGQVYCAKHRKRRAQRKTRKRVAKTKPANTVREIKRRVINDLLAYGPGLYEHLVKKYGSS